jgi:heptose-I-phosphate ethanolaminephosphotransferase
MSSSPPIAPLPSDAQPAGRAAAAGGPIAVVSDIARRYPALSGSLLVACGYALMNLGWRDAAEVTLVYCLGAYALHAVGGPGRGYWLPAAWNLAFLIDLGVKAFLVSVYKSAPDAPLVIEGISNTNSDESAEFLLNYWQLLGAYSLQILVLAALLLLATRPHPLQPPSRRPLAVVAALLFALLHLDPELRRANPLVFWTAQAATIDEFRANLDTLHEKRARAQASLPQWAPAYTGPAQHTLGLVIGESTNRWNWQLYGYARPTTPELAARADQLMVFRDVLSASSSTVSALRHMLTPRTIDRPSGDEALPSVLMLAKAAGYKVYWISNQHDRYISTRFIEEADVAVLLNQGSTDADLEARKLDERVLPAWRAALSDPAPRKLIVVHLMGAHAHYDLRSPPDHNRFEGSEDAIDHELTALGRPAWVRLKRDQYDDAMLYQDRVISTLLDSFREALGNRSGAWLYTSDHGEEVGHTRNFTGHSPDEAGQVVPMLLWKSEAIDPDQRARIEQRPYQSDVLDWTLLDLMHIRTAQAAPEHLVLRDSFMPRERRLHDGSVYTPSASRLARAN